jgi:outer membrane murein-binding lipoprotein Lpp
VTTKSLLIAAILIGVLLSVGCAISCKPDSSAAQVIEDNNETASQQQEAQLREDLRLANERARLAEERAELEKQKREFAEEQLNTQQEGNDENGSVTPDHGS